MNQSLFYLLILLFTICGCHSTDKDCMNIEGQISSNYKNQIMYLVPRPHPTLETVDSTFVKEDGSFSFSIHADSAIYDITISRKAKANIQRLLIISERGTLYVTMNTSSSAHGTPLNNKLQHWKELMETTGTKAILLSQKISKNQDNSNLVDSLKKQQEKIYENFGDSTFCFIKQNLNPLGGYLFMTMENLFNEKQITNLKKTGIERWKPKQ